MKNMAIILSLFSVGLSHSTAGAAFIPDPLVSGSSVAQVCYGYDCYPTTSVVKGTNTSASYNEAYGYNKMDLSKAPKIEAYAAGSMPTGPFGEGLGGLGVLAGGSNLIHYYLFVQGPSGDVRVPTKITANASLDVTGGRYWTEAAQASADLYVGQIPGGPGTIPVGEQAPINQELILSYNEFDTSGHKHSSFSYDQEFNLLNNTYYEIIMSVGATVSMSTCFTSTYCYLEYNEGIATAYASMDPYFEIDPAYAKLGYTLTFSPGINNSLVSAVPLPASASMFGAALLALASIGYAMNRWVAPMGRRAAAAA